MQKIDKKNQGNSRTVGVVLTEDQIEWVESQGKKSEVIRALIDNQMRGGT